MTRGSARAVVGQFGAAVSLADAHGLAVAVVGELRDAAVTVYEAADKVRTLRVVQADGLVALTVHVDAQPSLVVVYVHLAAAVGVRDTGEVAVIVVTVARDAALGVDGAVRLHEVRVAVARLVAERVDLGGHKLVGRISVGGRAARGVGHEVVAFGRWYSMRPSIMPSVP